jgi:phosphoribosylaminoimidazole carboxylase (NCAIR synthetase)
MINFLGSMPPPEDQQNLSVHGWTIHDYGKKPAPGRKVGHATRLHRY